MLFTRVAGRTSWALPSTARSAAYQSRVRVFPPLTSLPVLAELEEFTTGIIGFKAEGIRRSYLASAFLPLLALQGAQRAWPFARQVVPPRA